MREAITTTAALEALYPEWESLWRKAGGTPFQSPAWLLPWWKHIGRGELACVALRDERSEELIGLAPLYVYRDDREKRHLFPLGIATTDYLDALALPVREDEVALALAAHVHELRAEWDVLEVPQLHREALWLRCRWPATCRTEIVACEPNPVVALPARLSRKLATNLGYARRRAAREDQVSIEAADADHVLEWIEALAELHARRWSCLQMPGVLNEPGVLAWHREAAPRLLRLGLLRLLALRVGTRVIGVLYCLADGPHLACRRWYDYIGGFDPEFALLSPGTLLIGHALDAATAEGATATDFLRGAEPYKYRWGAVDQPMWVLRVHQA